MTTDLAAAPSVAQVPEPPPARYAAPPAVIDPDRSKGWIARLMPLLSAHRRTFGISLGASILGQSTMLLMPVLVQRTIDLALIGRSVTLWSQLRPMLVVAVVGLVAGLFSRRLVMKTGALLQFDLRATLQRHLGRQSFAYHDTSDTGQLISRANSDIRVIEMFLIFAPTISTIFISFVLAIVIMFRAHVWLTLLTLAFMPLVFIFGLRMRKLTFPLSWLIQARTAEVATVVEENLAGAHVVRAMAAESDQIARLDRAAEALRWASLREIAVRATYQPLLEAIPRVGVALFVLVAGWLAIRGSVTIGTVVLFTSYLGIMQFPFRVLGFMVLIAQRARAAAGRVLEIIDRAPDVQDHPGAPDLVCVRGTVDFEDIHFAYGDGPPVLAGLDLTIQAGQKVALVGRSASGKSTLASLVPRFYDVTDGVVRVDGTDVRDVTQASLRAHIGLVMDEPFLFTTTIRDNIAYARPDAELPDIIRAAETAGAREFIEALPEQWDTVVGERGYTLSGGQRQRIAIARVLVQNPAILILDDATSAIDVEVERQIHDALERLLEGRTTLLIAHRPATIALADRVALLHEGRVVAEGSHEELLATEPRYADVLAMLESTDAARRRQRRRQSQAEVINGDERDRFDVLDRFGGQP